MRGGMRPFAEAICNSVEKKQAENFKVNRDYRIVSLLGHGAYGVVCSAVHRRTGAEVAVKKVTLLDQKFSDEARFRHALKILREIRLVKNFHHPNIINLYDIVRPRSPELNELYLVMDLMDADLESVLRPKKGSCNLTPTQSQHIMYQILSGASELHRRGVMHRDLKPANILLNADCSLKIADFGLARETDEGGCLTSYVLTRYYRAPELILEWNAYTSAIDMWAIGCIFAELLRPSHKLLFQGCNLLRQVELIQDRLGLPTEDELSGLQLSAEVIKQYLMDRPKTTPLGFDDITTDPKALGLLSKLLQFLPGRRGTADECLNDRYFSDYSPDTDDWEDDSGEEGAMIERTRRLSWVDLQLDRVMAEEHMNHKRVYDLLEEEIMRYHR